MPRRAYADTATPKATNRGRVNSLAGAQVQPGLPLNSGSRESSRESFRDEDEGESDDDNGSYQSDQSSAYGTATDEDGNNIEEDDASEFESNSEDNEINSEYGSSVDSSGDFTGIEEGDEEGEEDASLFTDMESGTGSEYEGEAGSGSGSGVEEEGDEFDDEFSRAESSVVEFTGMEAVREVERQKRADSHNPPSSSRPPAPQSGLSANSASTGGDDLLKQYMGVLHGGGDDDDDDDDDSMSETMENRITKGVAKSSHQRNDFILNQSLSEMSVGSKSTRQSRREMVMVAQRLNFLEDDPAEMTYTRQIALYLMKRYKWYNPRLGEPPEEIHDDESTQMGGAYRTKDGYPMLKVRPENPSLEAAWAYFEHFTLTRFVYEPKPMEDKAMLTKIYNKFQKGDKEMERAERNENILPTKLYDPIWTPHNQLGDWGIGWGLYFASLRGLMVLCLVAGLCSIPNMVFFAGSYSGGQEGVQPILASSAICTDEEWVACPRCAGLSRDQLPLSRLAYAVNENFGDLKITYALKTNCNGSTLYTGMVHFSILLVILFGLVYLNRYLMKMESIFDADEQTAQDYTIVIDNPPPDATDPEEWKDFFVQNLGANHVVAVTVAVDNDDLVKNIVERRESMKMLELLLDPGTLIEMNVLAGIAAKVDRERGALASFVSFISPGIPEIFRRVVVLTIAIRGLAQQDYPATKVFATFETEGDQRRIMQEMAVGSLYIQRDDKSVIKDPKYLFRGEHMLYVEEPLEEPNSYRWTSMNERFLDRLWQQILTSIATVASICLVAFIVRIVHAKNALFSAMTISISNGSFPEFAKLLTNFEGHATEAGVQTSMYLKIALFRWVNTAVVITIITPFTSTLVTEGGLITQIYALFFTEIFTMNVLQIMDFYGHFMRHFLAPRAKTQDSMNIQMKGLEVELAERYTNLTKIFFLVLWYSSIYPAGFFMASGALFINYFTDRHSLMRTWKRAPPLGPGISEFSRRYFVSTSFLAMAIMSSYFWASFPFDNLCENDYSAPPAYYDEQTLLRFDSNQTETITLNAASPSYRFCNQDFFKAKGRNFPFIPSHQPEGDEWMTDDQETVTLIYGWAAVGAIAFIGMSFIQGWIEKLVQYLFGESISVVEDQRINFSDVTNISAYIPHVPSDVFSYPLFVCNMEGIGEEVIDWRDPLRSHAFYDLTKDADKILEGIDMSNKCVFSQMKHWPPDAASVPTFNNSLLGGSQDADLLMSESESGSEDEFDFGLN